VLAISKRIKWAERPQSERNAWLFLLEAGFFAAVFNLTSPFLSMFAMKMGASDYQLGMVSALPGLLGMFCLIPGSLFVESCKDNKRVVAMLALLSAACYPLIALTPWLGSAAVVAYLVMLGVIQLPAQVFIISWQSFFSDVIPAGNQNTVYARRQQVYTIVSVVVNFFAGIGLSYLPKNELQSITTYQIFFVFAFLLGIVQVWMITRIKGYQPHTTDMQSGWRAIVHALTESMKLLWTNKPFRNFTIIAFVFHLTWHIGWTQFFLFQVQVLGANEAWLSYLNVASCVTSILTFGFWSKVIDKHGPRFPLLIGMLGLGLNPILNAISTSLWPLIPVHLLMGMTFSAFQLALFRNMLDAVPVHNKTLNIAIYTTILNISAFVMPIVGVSVIHMWAQIMPQRAEAAALFMTGVLRLIAGGAMILITLRSQRKQKLDRMST